MNEGCNSACCFKPCALGMAFAVWWALTLIVMSVLAMFWGLGLPMLGVLASFYVGFSLSYVGILIGVVWALVDGFIAGVILAWLYNWFACKCCKK
jgi:hypothetical protein